MVECEEVESIGLTMSEGSILIAAGGAATAVCVIGALAAVEKNPEIKYKES